MNNMVAPPNEKESEFNILGTLMKNNELMNDVIDKLKPEDFYYSKNVELYKAMRDLYIKDTSFDEMILYSKISKEKKNIITRSEIFQISSHSFEATFKSHVDNVIEASKQRKIMKLSEITLNQEMSSKEKLEKLEEMLFKIEETKNENRVITANELLENSMIKIDEAYNSSSGITGIKTGIKILDAMLNGLQRKNMIIIGARPSCGKTAFSLKLIKEMEANCLYVQLDMGLDEIGCRMLSSDSQLSNMKVSRGRLNDGEFDKLAYSFSKLSSKKNLFFYSPSETTVSDIRSKAKQLKMQKGLDVIIIDHIGKITPETKGTVYEQTKIISNRLKCIFRELDVAGVVLCQLSRAVEQRSDKHPIMADLRDSGNIEEDADTIGLLYRDGYYQARQKNIQIVNDVLEVDFPKVRNGRTGKIEFDYNLETQELQPKFNGGI